MLSLRDTCFATTDAAARHKRFRHVELISQGRESSEQRFHQSGWDANALCVPVDLGGVLFCSEPVVLNLSSADCA
jgi:hypothetical protein